MQNAMLADLYYTVVCVQYVCEVFMHLVSKPLFANIMKTCQWLASRPCFWTSISSLKDFAFDCHQTIILLKIIDLEKKLGDKYCSLENDSVFSG